MERNMLLLILVSYVKACWFSLVVTSLKSIGRIRALWPTLLIWTILICKWAISDPWSIHKRASSSELENITPPHYAAICIQTYKTQLTRQSVRDCKPCLNNFLKIINNWFKLNGLQSDKITIYVPHFIIVMCVCEHNTPISDRGQCAKLVQILILPVTELRPVSRS